MSKLETYQGLVLVIKSLCLMEILLSNWHHFLFIAIKKPPKTKINQRITFVNRKVSSRETLNFTLNFILYDIAIGTTKQKNLFTGLRN